MKGPAVLLQLKSTWEFGNVSKIITELSFFIELHHYEGVIEYPLDKSYMCF